MVGVEICGHGLGSIDALWTDHKSYHYSLPVTFSFVADPKDCPPKNKEDPVTFSVISVLKSGRSEAGRLPRGNEKFKVYAFNACYHSETNSAR